MTAMNREQWSVLNAAVDILIDLGRGPQAEQLKNWINWFPTPDLTQEAQA